MPVLGGNGHLHPYWDLKTRRPAALDCKRAQKNLLDKQVKKHITQYTV